MRRYSDYDDFAHAYNLHWSDFAYRVMPILDRLALNDSPPGAAILDLCCGNGHLARQLSERGYKVTGVDGSEQMLNYARQNAPEAAFHCADARDFAFDSQFAIAFSTYDSLNHIMTLSDLRAVFKNTQRHLQRGGLFVFDMNLPHGYPARWKGAYNFVSGQSVVVMTGIYDDKTRDAAARLTIFTRSEEESSLWRRKDLWLTQRAYTIEEVRDALAISGYTDIETFEASDLGMRQVGRAFFRARKP